MNDTEARANWDLLRTRLEQDVARYQAKSVRLNDYWDHNAYALQGVLDTMNVYEFGLEYAQARISERYSSSVPGLAEHTAPRDSDTQPDPYIDAIADEHVSEYEPECRCGHVRSVHYRDGSEQGGGCDGTQIGDAPSRCRCKGFGEMASALAEHTAAAQDKIIEASR